MLQYLMAHKGKCNNIHEYCHLFAHFEGTSCSLAISFYTHNYFALLVTIKETQPEKRKFYHYFILQRFCI